jgi:hypothetical protein
LKLHIYFKILYSYYTSNEYTEGKVGGKDEEFYVEAENQWSFRTRTCKKRPSPLRFPFYF